jgi:hypothetical protein
MPDQDGYPTDEEIRIIKEWPISENYYAWFAFIRSCWWYADWGWHEEDAIGELSNKPVHRYSISTGGWSGNESIIEAMQDSLFPWITTWVKSERGGHYVFHVDNPAPSR